MTCPTLTDRRFNPVKKYISRAQLAVYKIIVPECCIADGDVVLTCLCGIDLQGVLIYNGLEFINDVNLQYFTIEGPYI